VKVEQREAEHRGRDSGREDGHQDVMPGVLHAAGRPRLRCV